jgi:hypothetical protein
MSMLARRIKHLSEDGDRKGMNRNKVAKLCGYEMLAAADEIERNVVVGQRGSSFTGSFAKPASRAPS